MGSSRFAAALGALVWLLPAGPAEAEEAPVPETVKLPPPGTEGKGTLEDALAHRRSLRSFADAPLDLSQVSRLLWAVQGVTSADGRRTAPSAGALYPLEVYLVAGRVDGLPAGVFRYVPLRHQLVRILEGDRRKALAGAAWGQEWVRNAPAVLVLAGVVERTARKYGSRAERYVAIEVGAAAQNALLEAVSLGLGAVFVGAFDDGKVSAAVGLGQKERPFALLPVGHAAPGG